MPIKQDGNKRWVEMEIVVPGTPEQVWHAMATGAGNTAWFTNVNVEERVGGAIRFDFGADGASSGEITVWQPPGHFGYVERQWMAGAPPVDTEITIRQRGADRCLARMTHTLEADKDDWDEQLEGFEKGWPTFFDVLRMYLAHFAGEPAACFRATAIITGKEREAWARVAAALNLTGAHVGDACQPPPGAPRLRGGVERIEQNPESRSIMIRLSEPANGIALVGSYTWGDVARIAISVYLYGTDAKQVAEAEEKSWNAWLEGVLASESA